MFPASAGRTGVGVALVASAEHVEPDPSFVTVEVNSGVGFEDDSGAVTEAPDVERDAGKDGGISQTVLPSWSSITNASISIDPDVE